MDDLFKVAVIAVIGTILCLTVKKNNPEIALLITIATGTIILISIFSYFQIIYTQTANILNKFNTSDTITEPLFKCVGISVISKISAELCRESGESALAVKVELTGTLACIAVTLPLLAYVINFISGML